MKNYKERIISSNKMNINNNLYKWIAFILGLIVFMIVFFNRFNTSVLAPYLVETFKVSSTGLGLMSSIYFYSYASLQPAIGALTDKLKPRKMLSIFILISALGTLIFANSSTFAFICIGRLLIGIGSSGVYVPVSWIITKYFVPNKRGFLFAIFIFSGYLGSLLAASPFARFINFLGWRNALTNVAYISFAMAIFIWLVVRDNNSTHINEKDIDNKETDSEKGMDKEKVSYFLVIKEIFKIPIIKYCIILPMTSYGAMMSFQALWAIPFFIDVYDMEKSLASDILTMLALGLLIGILFFGRFYDTKYGKIFFIIGPISSLITYLLLFFFAENFTSVILYKILFFVWGFFQGAGPYLLKIYSVILPNQYYGIAMGIINIFPLFGTALYLSITGVLFDIFGGGENVLHRTIGSYKLYFLFLTFSVSLAIFVTIKIIHILNTDYKGKL